MAHFEGDPLLHVHVLDIDEGGRREHREEPYGMDWKEWSSGPVRARDYNDLPKNRYAGLIVKYFNGKTLQFVAHSNYLVSFWIEQIALNVRERVGAEGDGPAAVFEESKGPGDWSLRKLEPCKTVQDSGLGHGDVLIICEDAGMTEGRLKKLMPGLTGRPTAGPSSKRQRVK